MLYSDLRAIADRINTGTAAPDTSRAFVVFNLTGQPLSGVAVFRADMAWPKDVPLPPVVIRELNGDIGPSALADWQEGPDRKGREDRRQISFALRFTVRDVPANGWRTYIASYTDTPVPGAAEAVGEATPGLHVIETLRHGGDLPSVGQFPGVSTPGHSPAKESPSGTAGSPSSAPQGLSLLQE